MNRPAYLDHTPGSSWTLPQLRSVAAEYRAGREMREIAQEIGVGVRSLRRTMQRCGVVYAPPSQPHIIARFLRDNGSSTARAIMDAHGMIPREVRRSLARMRNAGRARSERMQDGSTVNVWRLTDEGREWLAQQEARCAS